MKAGKARALVGIDVRATRPVASPADGEQNKAKKVVVAEEEGADSRCRERNGGASEGGDGFKPRKGSAPSRRRECVEGRQQRSGRRKAMRPSSTGQIVDRRQLEAAASSGTCRACCMLIPRVISALYLQILSQTVRTSNPDDIRESTHRRLTLPESRVSPTTTVPRRRHRGSCRVDRCDLGNKPGG
jgi:hypothetical protein